MASARERRKKKGTPFRVARRALTQRKSHSMPYSGTSQGLLMFSICFMLLISGDRPPWMQKIFSPTMAANGRQLNTNFHSSSKAGRR